MNAPPYHLRPNKSIDRHIMIEAILRLEKHASLDEFTYFGLGGPYLEDFRALYDACQDIQMVSIERDENVFARQQFHKPCSTLKLCMIDLDDFIGDYEPNGRKCIFWLDCNDLNNGNIENYMMLLQRAVVGSVIKITLPMKIDMSSDGRDEFKTVFEEYLINPDVNIPIERNGIANLFLSILRVATEKTLPGSLKKGFLPVNAFTYSDGTPMLTLTGILVDRDDESSMRDIFSGWKFADFKWSDPRMIQVPILSTKERLRLQSVLPCEVSAGQVLADTLGYRLNRKDRDNRKQLEFYAEFHRQYPYFLRGVP